MKSSAAARFRRKSARGDRLYRHLYAFKKKLTTTTDRAVGERETTTLEFAKVPELMAAYEAGCRASIAEGWEDFTHGGWEATLGEVPKRPSAAEAERRFEAMSAQLAAALSAAGGKAVTEKKAFASALSAYATLKKDLGAPPLENAVHFFAVDGVGLKKRRKAALLRVKADAATSDRWLRLLETSAASGRVTARVRAGAAPRRRARVE